MKLVHVRTYMMFRLVHEVARQGEVAHHDVEFKLYVITSTSWTSLMMLLPSPRGLHISSGLQMYVHLKYHYCRQVELRKVREVGEQYDRGEATRVVYIILVEFEKTALERRPKRRKG